MEDGAGGGLCGAAVGHARLQRGAQRRPPLLLITYNNTWFHNLREYIFL